MRFKTMIRNAAARLLAASGLTSPERCSRGRLAIVTFHRVLPAAERQAYPYPGLVVTPAELDWYLTQFARHFTCDTLSAQDRRFRSGNTAARPLLAVTFDDGQYDNYLHARPILAKHRVKATFFVPVVAVEQRELLWHDRLGFAVLALLGQPAGAQQLAQILAASGRAPAGAGNMLEHVAQESKKLDVEARLNLVQSLEKAAGGPAAPEFARLMTFTEIAGLAADGHEIGSHSMTHCMMPECDDAALQYELAESRSRLQVHLGLPIESFCYPNGNCDERTAAATGNAGYSRAVTTRTGHNEPATDRFQLRRHDMVSRHLLDANGRLSPALLAFRMSGFYPGLG